MSTENYGYGYLDHLADEYIASAANLLDAVNVNWSGQRLRDVTELSACDDMNVVMC